MRPAGSGDPAYKGRIHGQFFEPRDLTRRLLPLLSGLRSVPHQMMGIQVDPPPVDLGTGKYQMLAMRSPWTSWMATTSTVPGP